MNNQVNNQYNNFNPSIPCRSYTQSQWEAKEDWYINECNSIKIPDSPTPADIQFIASRIDAILSTARIDYAFVSQKYDKYNSQLKIQEKKLFVDLKLNPPSNYAGLKLTVDEMKGVVASVLSSQSWNGTQYSLYHLVEESSARNIFMEAIIKNIQDKKDLLITHSGMLKIENSLNSLNNNYGSVK